MKSNKDKLGNIYDELLEELVDKNHPYRKIKGIIKIEELVKPLEGTYSKVGKPGEPVERGFKGLLLQYWEDLSDRQLERLLRENLPAKLFCGYGLGESTPDHSYFGKLRDRIGVELLTQLFNKVIKQLEQVGLVGNIFAFCDASSLISKVNIWEARDKAMQKKEKTLNNTNIKTYSSDPEARFGCKGKNQYWFGYKRHNVVDMRQGIITKVAITDASVPDFSGLLNQDLIPKTGMVFLDKGYDYNQVYEEFNKREITPAIIKKINRKDKNKELDKWRSTVRMPYENVFSGQSKFAKYRGKLKVLFQAIFEALAYNLKRVLRVNMLKAEIR